MVINNIIIIIIIIITSCTGRVVILHYNVHIENKFQRTLRNSWNIYRNFQ